MKEMIRIKEQLINNPWLITQEGFLTLQSYIEDFVAEDIDIVSNDPARDYDKGIAVVPVQGTLMRGVPPLIAKLFGMTDTSTFRDKMNMLAEDVDVKGVLLDVDSPGGSASGIEEASEAVKALDGKKPVYSYVEGMMASASYWIGSQARTIVASNSSKVGSIGVYLPVVDSSESYKAQGINVELIKNKEATFKGAGFDGTSLSEEQKENMQEMVQDIFNDFKGGVLSARPQISEDSMRGQVFLGKKAKAKGLIDINGSYEDAISMLRAEISR